MTRTAEKSPGQEPGAAGEPVAVVPPAQEYVLNVAVLYQDAQTHKWARQMCEHVAGLIGSGAVRHTWWKLGDLSQPGVLAGAVSTTMRADVIVVAIQAAARLPLPFYVWVDAWLPHRLPQAGALVALIGLPEPAGLQSDQAREYLRAVAQQGRLDFLLQERKLPVEGEGQQSGAGPSRFGVLSAGFDSTDIEPCSIV